MLESWAHASSLLLFGSGGRPWLALGSLGSPDGPAFGSFASLASLAAAPSAFLLAPLPMVFGRLPLSPGYKKPYKLHEKGQAAPSG